MYVVRRVYVISCVKLLNLRTCVGTLMMVLVLSLVSVVRSSKKDGKTSRREEESEGVRVLQ